MRDAIHQQFFFIFTVYITLKWAKLHITPRPKFITLFHKTIKNLSDERKVKKEAENERYGQVKQRKHHMEFISATIVYLAAPSNPTHSEISDINLFIS